MIQCCTSRLQFTDGRTNDAQKLDFLCALGAAAMICDVQPLYRLISCVHLLSSPNFYSILVSCCFTSGLIPEAPIRDELADFEAFKHWIICPCPTFVRAIHLLGSYSFIFLDRLLPSTIKGVKGRLEFFQKIIHFGEDFASPSSSPAVVCAFLFLCSDHNVLSPRLYLMVFAWSPKIHLFIRFDEHSDLGASGTLVDREHPMRRMPFELPWQQG